MNKLSRVLLIVGMIGLGLIISNVVFANDQYRAVMRSSPQTEGIVPEMQAALNPGAAPGFCARCVVDRFQLSAQEATKAYSELMGIAPGASGDDTVQ